MTGKVVVFVTPQFGKHRHRPYVVSQFPELGLSAYGADRDEALKDLKGLLRTFIARCRESGVLEERLRKAEVKWMTVDAARIRGIAFEDLDPDTEPKLDLDKLVTRGSIIDWESTSHRHAGEERDLLVAA